MKTRNTRRRLAVAALAALAAFAFVGTGVADAKKIVIKLGSVAPDGTPWAKQIKRFKKRIERDSGGRIKFKIYNGFSKGGEKEVVRRCVRGTLQMCGATVGALAAVAARDLNVLEWPYLFKSSSQADRILDGPALPIVKRILRKKGLIFAGWSENGWRGFASRKQPITDPSHLKGLKMRAQESRVHVQMYKALGANPVAISVPEVLGALQRGVVDGYDNTPLYMIAASWYKHVRHFTVSKHIYQPVVIAYNKKFFDKLPKDLQKVLLKHGAPIAKYARKLIRAIDPALLKNLEHFGIKVKKLTAAQRAKFRKATAKARKKLKRRLRGDGRKLLKAILKAR